MPVEIVCSHQYHIPSGNLQEQIFNQFNFLAFFPALLSSCRLNAGVTDLDVYRSTIPQEAQLKVVYDVYLPTVAYKKSNPPIPSKRVAVMRYDDR